MSAIAAYRSSRWVAASQRSRTAVSHTPRWEIRYAGSARIGRSRAVSSCEPMPRKGISDFMYACWATARSGRRPPRGPRGSPRRRGARSRDQRGSRALRVDKSPDQSTLESRPGGSRGPASRGVLGSVDRHRDQSVIRGQRCQGPVRAATTARALSTESRSMRHTHSLLLSCVLAAVLGTAHAAPATAMGKIRCDLNDIPTVAIGQYDPITNHNGTGAAHEHQFFGNTAWHVLPNPNTANYADLVGKQNNCRNVLGLPYSADSAGYWTPTLRYKAGTPKAGQLIAGRQFTAYFRGYNGQTFGPGMASCRHPADSERRLRQGRPRLELRPVLRAGPARRDRQPHPRLHRRAGRSRAHTDGAHQLPDLLGRRVAEPPGRRRGRHQSNAHYRYPSGKGVCPPGSPTRWSSCVRRSSSTTSATARTSSWPATRMPAFTTARRCMQTSGTPGVRASSWTTSGSA